MAIEWKVSENAIYSFIGDVLNKHVYVGVISRSYGTGYYIGVSSGIGVENQWRESKTIDADVFKAMAEAENFLKECLAKHMETEQ